MNLSPISNNGDQSVCPNVHVYFILKDHCSACEKFKSNGELNNILSYLKGKMTTSVHNLSTIDSDMTVPEEIKHNIKWIPLIICEIRTDGGSQFGVMNGRITSSGTIESDVKYTWNKADSIAQWLCDVVPKQYCGDRNICIDGDRVLTQNPFYYN